MAIKVAIYEVQVFVPDDYRDEDWPEQKQTGLDDAFSAACEAFKSRAIERVDGNLTFRQVD